LRGCARGTDRSLQVPKGVPTPLGTSEFQDTAHQASSTAGHRSTPKDFAITSGCDMSLLASFYSRLAMCEVSVPKNQLLVRAASNLSLVNISKGRSNHGGVGFIVTRKQNVLSGIGMAVSAGILEESASYTDTNGYQSGEAIYRTLVPTVAHFKEHGRAI